LRRSMTGICLHRRPIFQRRLGVACEARTSQ